jgi:hypothetical protein
MKYLKIIMAITAWAAAAYGAEDLVVNGGFEQGEMGPWQAKGMEVSAAGAYTGSYGAYFYVQLDGDCANGGDAEQTVWGELRQALGREVKPAEVRGVDLWVYFAPDTENNPWGLDVKLGLNEKTLTSTRGELKKGWNHVWFPVEEITLPFSDVYVKASLVTG